ncbi:hypothetical protein BH10PSE1_BH10PSE1_01180 [soil metagenome]
MRVLLVLGVGLLLSACANVDPFPDTGDLCRDSSRCSPQCGTATTGASGDCTPAESGGRTRG